MTDISRLGRPTPRYNDPLPEGGELVFECRIIGHPKPPKSKREEGAGSRQWREVTQAQLAVGGLPCAPPGRHPNAKMVLRKHPAS